MVPVVKTEKDYPITLSGVIAQLTPSPDNDPKGTLNMFAPPPKSAAPAKDTKQRFSKTKVTGDAPKPTSTATVIHPGTP